MSHYGLSSKDYSDFSKVGPEVEQHAGGSRQSRIASGLQVTQSQLQAASSVISNPSSISKASKVSKQIINTLLAPAKSLAELLGIVSEATPQTAPVAELFKGLLRLELDRQENDKHIATLYHSMSSMLVVLAKLDDVFTEESDLAELLDHKLDEIVNILNEFGNFCDVYYKHRTVVRFLRVSKYLDMLEGFAESFVNTRHELEAIVLHHTTLTAMRTYNVVEGIATEVAQLNKFLSTQTTREREAQNFVKAKGGAEAVIKDNKLLSELATKLGDSITSSLQANRALQYSLHADLETQIQENQSLFILKLQCVKEEIEETVNRSTTTILMKLDAGPHEVINDPDIKAIWKDMQWRNTVKSRHFVSAVHHYFEQYFIRHAVGNNGAPHPDLWTLNYLSRVIFYPAIADAIDEDTSGYVSLHELNHFFDDRPKGWSVPQWLAYWAAGWYLDNLQYREKILGRLTVFEHSIEKLHPANKELLRGYLNQISDNIKLIAGSLYRNELEYFEEGSSETVELTSLRERYTEHITKEVEESLEKVKHELDDKRTLGMVIGTGNRLESRLLCVIHRLLKRHHRVFDSAKDKPLQGEITIAMVTSFQVIFDEFTRRARSLQESWRQQRMNVAMQAEWYANGLFEDWYKKDQQVPDEYDYDEEDLSEADGESAEDQEELEEYAAHPSMDEGSAMGDPDAAEEETYPAEDDDADGADQGGDENEGQEHDDEDGDQQDTNDDGDAQDQTEEHDNQPTAHEREVDERLSKLEERMDDLKDLMLRILERLDG